MLSILSHKASFPRFSSPALASRWHARPALSRLVTVAAASALVSAWLLPQPVQAGVIEHADIGGFRTFQDDQTGRIWADLDNYIVAGVSGPERRFNTYGAYIDALQNAGFTWSTGTPVYGLLGTLPLTGGMFSVYSGVMLSQYGVNIELIRGITDTGGPWLGQIGNNSTATAWTGSATLSVSVLTSSNSVDQPQGHLGGIWAYMDAVPPPVQGVPEPGSLVLASTALALMLARHRRARSCHQGTLQA